MTARISLTPDSTAEKEFLFSKCACEVLDPDEITAGLQVCAGLERAQPGSFDSECRQDPFRLPGIKFHPCGDFRLAQRIQNLTGGCKVETGGR